MIFRELEQKAYNMYPAMLIDKLWSHGKRNATRTILLWVLLLLLLIVIIQMIITVPALDQYVYQIRGLFLLIFSLWLMMFLLESMYLSYYFRNDTGMDFAVSKVVLSTEPHDVTGAFLKSRLGQFAMMRLGIGPNELDAFLKTRTDFVEIPEYEIVPDEKSPYISVAEYGRSLIHFDDDLKKFLAQHGVNPDMFKYALMWVAKNQKRMREYECWWSRDNLARIPSLGKDWSFGQVYLLEKFGHIIFAEDTYLHLGDKWRLQQDTIRRLEQILVKEAGANVMLVCQDDAIGMEVVSSLAKTIVQGIALPELESKRIYVLDGTALISTMRNKADFEVTFRNILVEASNAGNVIVVIPRMARFAESASHLGVDVENVLSEALASNTLQVIALSSTSGFHSDIEPNHNLMRHFDKVAVEGSDDFQVISVLQDEANYVEGKYKIFFTYQSLVTIAESANRYFSDGSVRNRAVDLLNELVPKIVQEKRVLVLKEDVLDLVEQKTGIPQGKVAGGERDQLNKLEEILHQRIVGQDAAVTAIADALRRARAGLTNPDRPMGSFLFLGPTGVGKTETTKALAETYFGDEDSIVRIDMSEYSSFNAVEKLIGSAQTGKQGILSTKLRQNKYGVLLLDEFEKTTNEVMNLFLQILDEGYFSDGSGNKVIARNMIIIATSNAGSDLIYKATEQGVDVSQKKKEIVDALISKNIFRPELVNRFDDVIVFHPLEDNHLENIAVLMIDKLNQRLEHDSIVIEPTESLIEYLIATASNRQFGAREMNRAVQDHIEKLVADGIISGDIETGDRIAIEVIDGDLKIVKR